MQRGQRFAWGTIRDGAVTELRQTGRDVRDASREARENLRVVLLARGILFDETAAAGEQKGGDERSEKKDVAAAVGCFHRDSP